MALLGMIPELMGDDYLKRVARGEKPTKPRMSKELKDLVDDVYKHETEKLKRDQDRSRETLKNFLFKNAELKPQDRIFAAKRQAQQTIPFPKAAPNVEMLQKTSTPPEYSKFVQQAGFNKAKEQPVKGRIMAHMDAMVPGLYGDIGKGTKSAYPGTVLATHLGKMYASKKFVGSVVDKAVPGLGTGGDLVDRLTEFGFSPTKMKKWMLIKDTVEWGVGAGGLPTLVDNLSKVIIGGDQPQAKNLIVDPLAESIKMAAVGAGGFIPSTPLRAGARMGIRLLGDLTQKVALDDRSWKAIGTSVALVGLIESLGGSRIAAERASLTYLENNSKALAAALDINYRQKYLELMGKSAVDIAHDPGIVKIFKKLTGDYASKPSLLEHIDAVIKKGGNVDGLFKNINLIEGNFVPQIPRVPIKSVELNAKYEKIFDGWIGDKDYEHWKADAEALKQEDALKNIMKHENVSKSDVDEAFLIHIDLKRKPDDIELADKFNPKIVKNIAHKKKIIELSQELPFQLRDLSKQLDIEDQELGDKGIEAKVILSKIDHHVNRGWKKERLTTSQHTKFSTKTPHAKHRVYNTIIEGWSKGEEMDIPGAIDSLRINKYEMHNAIADKKFINEVKDLTNIEGLPIFTTKFDTPGYDKINHPNFVEWIVKPGNTIPEKTPLYAPKEVADELNKILEASTLKKIPVLNTLVEANNLTKGLMMQGSFFHDISLTTAYYFTTPLHLTGESFIDNLKRLDIRQAYAHGKKTITDLDPQLELLVRNGMTLHGRSVDWQRTKLDPSVWSKTQKSHVDWLFGKLRPYLKANGGLLELKRLIHKYPFKDSNELAKAAGETMNHIFGGEHLGRMGRNQTVQHIFRILGYSPDFTEGTVRLGINAAKPGMEGEVARRIFARVYGRTIAASVLMNILLHGKKTPDVYVEAWRNGKLRFLDIDITPVYKLFGGEDKRRRYINLTGQFKDQFKFLGDPGSTVKNKVSPVVQTIYELIKGETPYERKLTGFPELVKTGQYAKYAPWEKSANFYSRLPSQMLHTLMSKAVPNPVEKLILFGLGQEQGFDALFQGIGVRESMGKSPKKKKKGFRP